jgi:hypothetical protein
MARSLDSVDGSSLQLRFLRDLRVFVVRFAAYENIFLGGASD